MDAWLLIGLLAQAMFFGRFLVQWIVAERSGEAVVPPVFWYLSLAGALLLLVYAAHREDPVFIAGQAAGSFVYVRNLMLIRRGRRSPA